MAVNAPKFKYKIDLSQNKYRSKYNRLMNILYYSGEIPSDLYLHMNMSYDNFRKAISELRHRGYLKSINRDKAYGYILTSGGRMLTRTLDYMDYQDRILEESRQYDIKHRSRKRQFAYLYALLDRAGIPYESFAKPKLEDVSINGDKVYFYTALDFKRMLGIEATIFKGSRILGFLFGRGRIIPVYRTGDSIKTFGRHEASIPLLMLYYFSVSVNTAILICNNEQAAVNIMGHIINNTKNDYKIGANTASYKNFYVLPDDDSFLSRFEDLYADYSGLMQKLIEQNNIETTERDDEGRYRILIGTGFYRNKPVWICPGNVNAVTLRLFVMNSKRNGKSNYIFCQDRDLDMISEAAESMKLHVNPIVVK